MKCDNTGGVDKSHRSSEYCRIVFRIGLLLGDLIVDDDGPARPPIASCRRCWLARRRLAGLPAAGIAAPTAPTSFNGSWSILIVADRGVRSRSSSWHSDQEWPGPSLGRTVRSNGRAGRSLFVLIRGPRCTKLDFNFRLQFGFSTFQLNLLDNLGGVQCA